MSSKQVDQRVVEMQFDNKQFEDNVQTSISTLDKLKKALKLEDAAEGFSELERAASDLDVSGATSALDELGGKFNWLETIATGALLRIGGAITDTLMKGLKSLTIDNFAAGWDKYGEKSENVATIMSATGKSIDDVNDQLEKLMWYTDETSYNFTDMASNIGKFTNNGVALEDAVTAMMGIGNWAGVSGANIQEASRAMYNLSQAMSVGEVKLMDWKSIQNANMATMEFKQQAIDAAVALGTLKEAGDGTYQTLAGNTGDINVMFSEMLKDGWFTADVLMDTLKKYGDYTEAVYKNADAFETCAKAMEYTSSKGMELGEKAFKAAQEARTFGQAIDATKDAVSSSLMTTFEIIFGNYEEAKVLWTQLANGLWDVFAGPISAFNDVLGPAFGNQWEDVGEKILETGVNAEDFEKRLAAAAKAAGLDVDGLIDKYGSLTKSLRSGWLDSGKLGKILDDILGDTEQSTVKTAKSIANLEEVVYDVIRGDYANNWSDANREREKLLTEAGYDAKLVQDLVNKVMWGEDVDFNVVIEDQLESLGYTEEQIKAIQELRKELEDENSDISKLLKGASDLGDEFASIADMSGRELFLGSIKNVLGSISSILSSIGAAFRDIFPATTSRAIWEALGRIYLVTQKIRDFFGNLATEEEKATGIAEQLRRVFRGFFAVLHVGVEAVKAVVGGIGKLVSFFLPSSGAVGGLLDFVGGFSDILVSFDKFITESAIFRKAINAIVGLVTGILTPVKKALGWLFTNVMEILTTVINKVGEAFSWLERNTTRAINFLTEAYHKLRDAFTEFLEHWRKTHEINLEPIAEAFSWIGEKLGKAFSKIMGILGGDGSSASSAISTIFEKIGSACNVIAEGFQKLIAYISPVATKFWEILTVGDGLGAAWKYLGDRFSSFIESIKDADILGSIGPFFSNAAEGLKEFGSNAIEYVKSLDIISKAKDIFGPLISGISDSLSKGFQSIGSGKGAIKELFKGTVDSISESLGSIQIVSKIKDKLEPVIDFIEDLAQKIINSIKKVTSPISSTVDDAVKSAKGSLENSGFYKSIQSLFGPKVEKTVTKTSEAVEKSFKSFGGAGGGSGFVHAKVGPMVNGIGGLNKTLGMTPQAAKQASESVEDFADSSTEAAEEVSTSASAMDIIIETVSGFFKTVRAAISATVDFVKGFNKTIIDTFHEWKSQNESSLSPIIDLIDRVKAEIKGFFSTLTSSVEGEGHGFGDSMNKVFGAVAKVLRTFLDVFMIVYNYLAERIGPFVKNIKKGLTEAFDNIKDSFKNNSFDSVFEGFEAIFGAGAFIMLRKFIKGLKKDSRTLTEALKELSDHLGGTLDGLKGALKGLQHELNARAIKHIGEAIVLLAVGITILAMADKVGDVEKAATIISILTAELAGIMALFNKFGKGSGGSLGIGKDGVKAMGDASTQIVRLAAGVLIMAAAVAMLAKLDYPKLKQGLEAITIIMGELTGTIVVMQLSAGGEKYTQKISKTLVAMAVAMLAMIKVVKKLGSMDPDALHQGLFAMSVIVAELTVIFVALGNTKESAIKAGKAIRNVSTALILMSVAMKIIATMNGPEFARGAAGVAGGLIIMTGALVILAKMGGKGKAIYSAGQALQAVSIGLVAMALAIKILSTIGLTEMAIAVGGMATALMAVAGVALFVDKMNVSLSLVALGAAFALIGVGIAGLGLGLFRIASALILLGTAGAIAVKGIEILGDAIIVLVKSWTKGILEYIIEAAPMFGEAVVALLESVGIMILGSITELVDPLIEALVLLTDALVKDGRTYDIIYNLIEFCVQVLIALFDGLAAAAPRLVKSFFNLLSALGLAIGEAFKDFDMKDVILSVTAIGILIAGMKVLASMKGTIKNALIAAGALVLITAALGGVFLLLNGVDGKNALIQATAMSEIMIAVAGMMKLMQGISDRAKPIKAAGTVIAELDLAILNLVAVLSVLGALDEYVPGFHDFINDGGQVLVDIAEILGKVIGAFVGGAFEGVASVLPAIGESLSGFFTNLSVGLNKMSEVKSETFGSLVKLGEALLMFTGASFIDGLGKWIGGSLDLKSFGQQLADFAPYIVEYSKTISAGGLSKDSIEKSASAGKILAEFAKAVPKEGGLWQDITGTTNLAHFGAQLAAFAPHLVIYARTTKDITGEMVEGSVNAAKMLADLANDLPSSGGWKSTILGDSDLGDFGQSLKELGRGLLSYASNVSSINDAKVSSSAAALTMLAALYNFVPPTGGWKQSILGEADLDEFGSQLEGLAVGLTKYSNGISTVDATAVAESATGLSALVSIGQAFANSDTGYFDLGDYGDKINTLGIYYAEFYKSVSRTVAKKVLEAIDVLNALAGVASSQNGTALSDLASALNDLSQVTLDSMVESFQGAGENVKSVGTTIVNDLVSGITEGATSSLNLSLVKGCGASLATEFLENISPEDSELKTVAVGMVSAFTSEIKNQQGLMTGASVILAEKFVSGISSGPVKLNVAGACGELVSIMKNQFLTHTDDFESIGGDIVSGLVRGMRNNAWKVRDAAEDLGATAEKGTKSKKGVDSNSPSKKFIKIGLYCVQGFVKGIVDNTKLVDKAVTKSFGKRLADIAQAQVDTFTKVYKKNGIKKVAKEVEKSIKNLGTSLYQQSDAYKETKKNLKDYNKELSKLQKEQKKYTKGSKDYKKVEKQINETRKKIKDAQKQAAKDAQSVFNDYYNSIKDQAKEFLNILDGNFDSQIDLFQKFEKEHKITARNVLRNMNSQINGVNAWKDSLSKLAETGIAEGLLQKLKDMGPSGAAYVEAFLKMSKEQLAEANKLFAEEQEIANKNFLDNAKARITEVKNWAAGISALAAKGLNQGLIQNLIDKGPEGYEYVQAFLSMSAKDIRQLNKTYSQTLSVPKSVTNEIVSAYAYAGTESAKGFAKGIEKGKSSAINAAVKLANEALKAAKKRLGIKSPSKEFGKIGDFAGQGFVNALYDYADRSYEAGSTIADSAESGLNDAIKNVVDILTGDIDSQPTITPQLDLTNVYDGMGELDTLFGSSNSVFATNSVRSARLAQSDISSSAEESSETGTGGTVYNFNQYNSSPKALSRLDIYRQTKNQFAMMKGIANA